MDCNINSVKMTSMSSSEMMDINGGGFVIPAILLGLLALGVFNGYMDTLDQKK